MPATTAANKERDTMKSEAYYQGLEAKKQEIAEMGFEAARDKFNSENPVGQKWAGSLEGLEYANGEMQALVDSFGK
jgi:hypothetical protein